MFILEEPYVSELLFETLEKNQFEVLNNSIVDKYKKYYNLNTIEKNTAKEFNKDKMDLNFYSNSENSIDWVLNNFKNSNLAKIINICKNKYNFRKNLKSIYPKFFFNEILLNDLDNTSVNNLKFPFIIKPTVGFLSLGVHKVNNKDEWQNVLSQIKMEIKYFSNLFPQKVLSSSSFIIEEIIQGEEYAVDAYYNDNGKPVILNIFKHPFVDADDVSDRAYITSKQIVKNKLNRFTSELEKIGKILNLKSFPMHIELIEKENGEIIPVEINPMRFAGWCTTDLAYYAYGINVYECYFNKTEPDWDKIFSDINDEIYYFAMADVPKNIKKENIEDFDYETFRHEFSNILEFRKINYTEKTLFAVLFGSTDNLEEITNILKLNMNNYIIYKEAINECI